MNNSNYLRWGIPGWTLFFSLVLFIIIDLLLGNDDAMFQLVSESSNTFNLIEAALSIALVAGAGIPIGFLLYQIYYYIRWNSPSSNNGLLLLFNGRNKELQNTLNGLDIKDITEEKGFTIKTEDHREMWDFISPMLIEAISNEKGSKYLENRHRYLLDILHSLGTSYLGIVLGFGTYLILKWTLGEPTNLIWIIISAPITTIIVMKLLSLEEKHDRKQFSILKFKVRNPAELYLTMISFLFISLNPELNRLLPYEIPTIISLVLVFVIFWGILTKDLRKTTIFLTAFFLILIIPLRSTNSAHLLRSIDWSILLSIIIFNFLTIVFLKNRETSRKTLITFQNYLLLKLFNKKSQ